MSEFVTEGGEVMAKLPPSAPATYYLGVDPGASGGMAIVNGVFTEVTPMLPTDSDIWAWFSVRDFGECWAFAVIEKVGGYIGEAQPGSSAFKFGASYGKLLMALTAAGIPFEEVTPQRWQKALGIAPRKSKQGETKTAFKNRLKQKAQQLFPGVTVTLATCDALLIAEFCRRMREGKL